jgi:hypothetical protein
MSIPAASSVRIPQPANQIVPKSALAPETRYAGGVTDGQSPNGGRPFSFRDLIDIVNPLQHIPVVSTLYRHITGDEISNFSRIAGGALFGGLAGIAIGGVNAITVAETGKDIGHNVLSKFLGDDTEQEQVATAATHSAPSKTSAAAGTGIVGAGGDGSIPVIEVRPQASATKSFPLHQETTKSFPVEQDKSPAASLPAERPVDALRDLEPSAHQPFTLSHEQLKDPNNKDAIQRAMMDALLKMQEIDDQAETPEETN